MFNAITHSQIFVLDQDEALDFYVGKLGLEVNADVDLGFMRWLTVSLPGHPERQILLEKPGRPRMSEETAQQVRELLTKGAMGGSLIFSTDDCRKTYETLLGRGRRVHRGTHRASLRNRLRSPRPLRQQHPLHPAGFLAPGIPGRRWLPGELVVALDTGGVARAR